VGNRYFINSIAIATAICKINRLAIAFIKASFALFVQY